MFGLMERARLGMYRSTLRQTISDVRSNGELLYGAGVMQAIALIGICVTQLGGAPSDFSVQESLAETIDDIPSAALPHVDSFFVENVKPTSFAQLPFYQAGTLVAGLVYVRILEVSKPKFAVKATEFENDALVLLEPLFDFGLRIMRASPHPIT